MKFIDSDPTNQNVASLPSLLLAGKLIHKGTLPGTFSACRTGLNVTEGDVAEGAVAEGAVAEGDVTEGEIIEGR